MKRKLRVIGVDGKIIEGEYNTRNLAHLEAQIKYRATVVEDKRKKSPKHKNKIFEES